MGLFEWTPLYEVGVPAIDRQHRFLMGLVNEMFEAVVTGQGPRSAARVLEQLKAYTHSHFRFEEALLTKAQDPGLAEHKELHRELLARLDEVQDLLEEGSHEAEGKAMELMRSWLIDHIRDNDSEHARYMRTGLKLTVVTNVAA